MNEEEVSNFDKEKFDAEMEKKRVELNAMFSMMNRKQRRNIKKALLSSIR